MKGDEVKFRNLLTLLRSMHKEYQVQLDTKHSFNEREAAKAELVRSILQKFDSEFNSI